MVYLGKKKPRKAAPRQIIKGKSREKMVNSVLNVLADWRSSEFQHEAICRHMVRRSLCLAGHGWAAADNEAAGVVSQALSALGAARPSWIQGQPQFLVPTESCPLCGIDLGKNSSYSGRRFCSIACRDAARVYRPQLNRHVKKLVTKAARYNFLKEVSEPKTCVQCGNAFKTVSDARHCSKACAGLSQARPERLKNCTHCGTQFIDRQKNDRGGKYCSPKCYREGRSIGLSAISCAECDSTFQPKVTKQKFCSSRCTKKNSARKLKQLAPPPLEQRSCDVCGEDLMPDRVTARFCSKACNMRVWNNRGITNRKAA